MSDKRSEEFCAWFLNNVFTLSGGDTHTHTKESKWYAECQLNRMKWQERFYRNSSAHRLSPAWILILIDTKHPIVCPIQDCYRNSLLSNKRTIIKKTKLNNVRCRSRSPQCVQSELSLIVTNLKAKQTKKHTHTRYNDIVNQHISKLEMTNWIVLNTIFQKMLLFWRPITFYTRNCCQSLSIRVTTFNAEYVIKIEMEIESD